mmetsp:Transcript_41584/g.125619  ORF Transcript_41584/g.125619 Transcript_41584/m.125619 type:complete len:276 (-) Transcript_41584:83-910(-)
MPCKRKKPSRNAARCNSVGFVAPFSAHAKAATNAAKNLGTWPGVARKSAMKSVSTAIFVTNLSVSCLPWSSFSGFTSSRAFASADKSRRNALPTAFPTSSRPPSARGPGNRPPWRPDVRTRSSGVKGSTSGMPKCTISMFSHCDVISAESRVRAKIGTSATPSSTHRTSRFAGSGPRTYIPRSEYTPTFRNNSSKPFHNTAKSSWRSGTTQPCNSAKGKPAALNQHMMHAATNCLWLSAPWSKYTCKSLLLSARDSSRPKFKRKVCSLTPEATRG